jgi:hypothetical protein
MIGLEALGLALSPENFAFGDTSRSNPWDARKRMAVP